jgi:hypothetical protein
MFATLNAELSMRVQRKSPGEIAQALGERTKSAGGWRRETFTMARPAARAKAREWFDRFPKAAYMTEIEFWRELEDGRIEFTIRRLPTAD